jgi:hypothetical protein
MFAQYVCLLFSSIYVCKETVELLPLSVVSGEEHHHYTIRMGNLLRWGESVVSANIFVFFPVFFPSYIVSISVYTVDSLECVFVSRLFFVDVFIN